MDEEGTPRTHGATGSSLATANTPTKSTVRRKKYLRAPPLSCLQTTAAASTRSFQLHNTCISSTLWKDGGWRAGREVAAAHSSVSLHSLTPSLLNQLELFAS